MLSDGFTINDSDKCIYSKVKDGNIIILCLYVDDILLFSNCLDVILSTKTFLSSHFKMTDLGRASVVLGLKLEKTLNGYSLSQSH